MKKLAFNSILLGFIALVSLGGAEVMVRLFAPQLTYRFPQGLFSPDAHTSYRLTPHFEGTLNTPEYRTPVRITGQGLRDDREYHGPSEDALRIVMLGDSFVMGVGVELEETLTEQLERTLGERVSDREVEIVNMGVAGYSTRQELAALESRGVGYAPDLVVLGFFVGNDFSENSGPPLRAEDGYLVNPVRQQGMIPYSVRRFVKLHSQLYHFVWPIQRRMRGHGAVESRDSARRIAEVFLTDDDAAGAITRPSLEALDELVTACERLELPLAVILIPDHSQVVTASWDGLVRQTENDPRTYTAAAPNRRLARHLERRGVPTLDLLPAFLEREDRDDLYLPIDKHWTASGHDVATDATADFVRSLLEPVETVETPRPDVPGTPTHRYAQVR